MNGCEFSFTTVFSIIGKRKQPLLDQEYFYELKIFQKMCKKIRSETTYIIKEAFIMEKRLKVVILSCIIILTFTVSTGMIFAISAEPQVAISQQSSFKAISDDKAEAKISASFSGKTPVELKITLQSAALNSTKFTDVTTVDPVKERWENVTLISYIHRFPITKVKDYRIKIDITDWANGNKTIKSYHVKLKR